MNTIALHLDNDETGRGAAASITMQLADRYIVRNEPVPIGKDCSDYLMHLRHRLLEQRRQRQQSQFCMQR